MPAFPRKTLPLLRVALAPDGTVEHFTATPDEWWDSVLAQGSAASRRDDDRQACAPALRGKMLQIYCGKCWHASDHDGDALAAEYPAATPVSFIAFKLAGCRHRAKSCQFRWFTSLTRRRS